MYYLERTQLQLAKMFPKSEAEQWSLTKIKYLLRHYPDRIRELNDQLYITGVFTTP